MKTLLIIPAYNEEESLQQTIESVMQNAPQVDFLIVNDGSADGTVQVCRDNH
ncbi:MAG: glycosyltransferase, partial [Eggerthellaceae bacterium]